MTCINPQLIDITTYSDYRKRLLCVICNQETDGGPLEILLHANSPFEALPATPLRRANN